MHISKENIPTQYCQTQNFKEHSQQFFCFITRKTNYWITYYFSITAALLETVSSLYCKSFKVVGVHLLFRSSNSSHILCFNYKKANGLHLNPCTRKYVDCLLFYQKCSTNSTSHITLEHLFNKMGKEDFCKKLFYGRGLKISKYQTILTYVP